MPQIQENLCAILRPPMVIHRTIKPMIDRWNHSILNTQEAIAFTRKAIEWLGILWGARTAIAAFNNDGEEIVELWLTNHQSAFKPGEIPIIISSLMFLQPEILTDWLDHYEPGQFSHYTHPEAVEGFEKDYGSLIRRSKKTIEDPESRFASAGASSYRE